MYYGGTGPYWLADLVLAERWGIPAWEIGHDPDAPAVNYFEKLQWRIRALAFGRLRAQKQQEDYEALNKRG